MRYTLPKPTGKGYATQPRGDFGAGLNLTAKADELGSNECLDAMNVEFRENGVVRRRDGFQDFVTLTANPLSLYPYYHQDGSTTHLLAGAVNNLYAVSTVAGVTGSGAITSGYRPCFITFNAPGAATNAYASNGKKFYQWNGAAWSDQSAAATVDGVGGKASPLPTAMDIMPTSNRLVAGGFKGTTDGPNAAATDPSKVFFSGDSSVISPLYWNTANYIEVTPGDGGTVTAIVAWREFVWVFKPDKYAVIYGESISGTGSPIFNYKVVDTGVGCPSPGGAYGCDDGVYFVDRKGLYRATGPTAPEKVSGPIDPVFEQGAGNPFYGGGFAVAPTTTALTYWDGRFYLAFSQLVGNDRMAVYDPQAGWWSLYDIAATHMCPWSTGGIAGAQKLYFIKPGTSDIEAHASGISTDDGTPIASRWQSGFDDFGSADEKTVRQSKLWGTGGPFTYRVIPDFQSPGQLGEAAATVDLRTPARTGGQYATHLARTATRGTAFSTRIEATTNWALRRQALHIRDTRISSVTEATPA